LLLILSIFTLAALLGGSCGSYGLLPFAPVIGGSGSDLGLLTLAPLLGGFGSGLGSLCPRTLRPFSDLLIGGRSRTELGTSRP
jgi:hypothetical protein